MPWKAWLQAVLSLVVVAASLYIIVAKDEDEAARQWAVGAIAFVLDWVLSPRLRSGRKKGAPEASVVNATGAGKSGVESLGDNTRP